MVATLTQVAALLMAAVSNLAPLPAGQAVAWSHAPYEVGACSICHSADDPKAPGPVSKPVNELCLGCHDQLKASIKAHKVVHAPVSIACTNCHNPHNAAFRKLLHHPVPKLCYQCHSDIQAVTKGAKVKHGAVTEGKSCLNCHNPHASSVQRLLVQLPYDVCVSCHGVTGLKDDQGHPLTNIKTLLQENPNWHGPVKGKDCSSCHRPHGSEHFRLLVKAYPKEFYASYDPANYELCFMCHNRRILTEPQTTTLTEFRDGKRNLHYLHVHKQERGRTCRACHDIHATKQSHQIRDGVPYGSSGWILPINYTETAEGGQCARTCHTARSYNNGSGQPKK